MVANKMRCALIIFNGSDFMLAFPSTALLAKEISTGRLLLRKLEVGDAPFMLELLNDPAYLNYIGDRGVRCASSAIDYIRNGSFAAYALAGYGFYCVTLKDGGTRIGICGLARRDSLDAADIGFAYLPQFRSAGYASEAALAVIGRARDALGLQRILAITSAENEPSARLLRKIGFSFDRMIRIADDEPEIRLFSWHANKGDF